jgi:hypothetical protein
MVNGQWLMVNDQWSVVNEEALILILCIIKPFKLLRINH